MSLSGSLKTMHAGDLLQWCGVNLKTGTLRLKYGSIEKQLFFKEGRLFSSTSNSPRETLGQFLIRSGKITEEELFTALIRQDRHREPLGQILIGGGLITDAELQELLRIKTEETIFDCFLWPDGEFVFEDGWLPQKIPVYLALDLTRVILEGARRADEWQRIREVFPSRLTTFAVDTTAIVAAGNLLEEDRRILDLAARGRNLAEIALEMHAVEFYAASRLLGHFRRGLVHVSEAPEEIPFEQEVEELKERLTEGVVCFNSGQYAKARTAFRAALQIDSQNKYARLFLLKIKRTMEDSLAVSQIPLDKVPVLKQRRGEEIQRAREPKESFVFSRINGKWSVRSILMICPMSEQESLLVFKRLEDDGLIEFV